MKMAIKKDKGFSLMEIMVTVGLGAFVMLILHSFFRNVNKGVEREQTHLEETIGNMLAEKVLRQDFILGKFSLNVIANKFDKDTDFFDYDASCTKNCDLKVSLTAPTQKGSKSSCFFLMRSDDRLSSGIQQPYSPDSAFNYTATGVPAYVSLNKAGILEKAANSPWKVGNILMLYNPRPVTGNEIVFMLGYVKSLGGAKNDFASDTLSVSSLTSSWGCTGTLELKPHQTWIKDKWGSATDPAVFLNYFPWSFGQTNYVFITPMRIFAYYLINEGAKDKTTKRVLASLYREEKYVEVVKGNVTGVKTKKQKITDNISEIFFERSVTSPEYKFSVRN